MNEYFLKDIQPFYYWLYWKVLNYLSAVLPAEENFVFEDDDSTIARWVCCWYELLSRFFLAAINGIDNDHLFCAPNSSFVKLSQVPYIKNKYTSSFTKFRLFLFQEWFARLFRRPTFISFEILGEEMSTTTVSPC